MRNPHSLILIGASAGFLLAFTAMPNPDIVTHLVFAGVGAAVGIAGARKAGEQQ